jgi:hypothetical protein
LVRHHSEISEEEREHAIVQTYIQRPLLIDGLKSDLRLYVAITSFAPLRVYLHDKGLVRFALERYPELRSEGGHPAGHAGAGPLQGLEMGAGWQAQHLTNSSLHDDSAQYIHNVSADKDDTGHKWSLDAFWRYIERSRGADAMSTLRIAVADLVVRTVLAAEPAFVRGNDAAGIGSAGGGCCFELFGMDVLIDSTLQPWLLEVNTSPAMHCPSPLDRAVKTAVVCDTLSAVGLTLDGVGGDNVTSSGGWRRADARQKVSGGPDTEGADTAAAARGGGDNATEMAIALMCETQALSPQEMATIRAFEAESARTRSGGLRCIYPAPGCEQYQSLFETWSPTNECLLRWVRHLRQPSRNPKLERDAVVDL